MKITKKAKPVKIKYKKFEYQRNYYICPSCKVQFEGCVNDNVIRFKCDCGQELKVVK